eukprot:5692988-Heterocapsa_arctica.AAC.1
MTYLEAMVLPTDATDKARGAQTKYCLLEWACDPRSRLAEWFVSHGHHAIRLGLPNVDLSESKCLDMILHAAENQVKAGYKIFLWASLPCTAWTTW